MGCTDLQDPLVSPADRRRYATALCVLVALGLIWRLVRYGLGFPLWGDEAFLAVSLITRDFGGLLKPLEYFQVAPLLFLWIERVTVLAWGPGEYALRLWPLLAGVSALVLFALWTWRTLRPDAALLASGIFAASYYLIRHTTEVKPYASDLFVATALLVLGSTCMTRFRTARVIALFALMVVGPWLSYPAVFVAGGVVAVWWLRALSVRRWRELALATLLGVVLIASFTGFYATYAAQELDRTSGSWLTEYWREAFPPWHEPGDLAQWLVAVHTGRMFAHPNGGPSPGSVFTFGLFVTGLVTLLHDRRYTLTALLCAPFALTFVAAALERYPYGGSVRVAMHLAPSICLLAGVGWATALRCLPGRIASHGMAVSVGLLALLCIAGPAVDIARPYKEQGDPAIRTAVSEIAAQIAPAQQIIIFNPKIGAHGPPDGPMLHQSVHYYLLKSGLQPSWRLEGGHPTSDHWLLVYHGPEQGPSDAHVKRVVDDMGLRSAESRRWPLKPDTPAALRLVRIENAAK